ncbi:MAG: low molecular weight protein-tyrosine-phosphatase [Burkholderiaceae bacterium]
MKTRVLFVCMGNICRSVTAEGVFRHMIKSSGLDRDVSMNSAGTHAYHIGNTPDNRAISAAAKRGYDISNAQARQIRSEDFRDYDLILAMDWDNLALLQQQCPKQYSHKLQLLMRFATEHDEAIIADPYHGGSDGFETVLNYIEDACTGLMELSRKRATQFAAA